MSQLVIVKMIIMSQTEDYDVRWGISAEADKFLRNNSDSVLKHCLQKERMGKKKYRETYCTEDRLFPNMIFHKVFHKVTAAFPSITFCSPLHQCASRGIAFELLLLGIDIRITESKTGFNTFSEK